MFQNGRFVPYTYSGATVGIRMRSGMAVAVALLEGKTHAIAGCGTGRECDIRPYPCAMADTTLSTIIVIVELVSERCIM